MKAAIIYNKFLDPEGNELAIGGIETYMHFLSKLCVKKGIEPVIYQVATRNFRKKLDDVTVVGVLIPGGKNMASKLTEAALQEIDLKSDLVIFGADRLAMPIGTDRCVSIQHGISFDLPMYHHNEYRSTRLRRLIGERLYQLLRRRRALQDYLRCPNRVCVDFNFLNWYRTFLHADSTGKDWVIPNFTSLAPQETVAGRAEKQHPLRVLFARRFLSYRGTRIMAEAAKGILGKHPDVQFTFAGGGPDEDWLKDFFRNESRVQITKYHHTEVINIHLQHDIAVVPSLGSEGTSLSVAEAMGCGCAVVASAIGGITNMILDGYNGLLCMPTADQIQQRLEELICDDELRLRIGARAYETAKDAFSLERWEQHWSRVIDEIVS
jgi:glycosyltransferase involved in cell wall biosynthesis